MTVRPRVPVRGTDRLKLPAIRGKRGAFRVSSDSDWKDVPSNPSNSERANFRLTPPTPRWWFAAHLFCVRECCRACVMNITELPDDTLRLIFGLLQPHARYHVELVCRTFRRVLSVLARLW